MSQRRVEEPLPVNGAFFSGDTSFFSLNGALQAIGKEKLTGTLRAFWNKETVDLLARNGEIILVTTRDPQLYCPEAPITLVNVDAEQTEQARAEQRETGCPLFLTLAREELILHEPAVQLVQHYGQKLFAQLWSAPRVRFVFEQSETLPDYAQDVPGEADIDHWVLTTLRCIQFQELGETADLDAGSIPAYTRDGLRTRPGAAAHGRRSAVRFAIQRRPLGRPDREESSARFQICPAHPLSLSRARNRGMLAAGRGRRETGKTRLSSGPSKSIGFGD